MHCFEELSDVQSTLQRLIEWDDPALVKVLPRTAGTKEARYMHLFGGAEPSKITSPQPVSNEQDQIAALEGQIAELKREMAELRDQFTQFRKQFE